MNFMLDFYAGNYGNFLFETWRQLQQIRMIGTLMENMDNRSPNYQMLADNLNIVEQYYFQQLRYPSQQLTPAQLEEQNIRANLIWQEHQRQQEEARLQQMATRRWQEEEEARLRGFGSGYEAGGSSHFQHPQQGGGSSSHYGFPHFEYQHIWGSSLPQPPPQQGGPPQSLFG
uniref:Uncharacterized protein n=1 Tax=Meloidogyne javanica TaxID=6303 RepID=A0A915LT58_MELJA